MKTAVMMKRELLGSSVTQDSKTKMLSATDLLKVGNLWRLQNDMKILDLSAWLNTKSTQEFVKELEEKFGKGNVLKLSKGGKTTAHHTWFHPLLFIDMALAISPKIKIEVYQWLFDELIKNRNDSGNSYKAMCGALYVRAVNKAFFAKEVQKIALKIKKKCNVTDWETATEEQLKLRDKLHSDIALLADVLNNNDEAVRLALEKNI